MPLAGDPSSTGENTAGLTNGPPAGRAGAPGALGSDRFLHPAGQRRRHHSPVLALRRGTRIGRLARGDVPELSRDGIAGVLALRSDHSYGEVS
ncbi:hypothetical protein ABT158_46920 [Nonomuraea sp. NPDC001636]|uniref:hypothetical protein n=1 Tax=Nonomuraea sp. NPDC001636 TaxID=3154391 RepID=UPI003325E25D